VLQGGLAPKLWDQEELKIQLWHNDSIPQGLSFAPKMIKIFNKVQDISPSEGPRVHIYQHLINIDPHKLLATKTQMY